LGKTKFGGRMVERIYPVRGPNERLVRPTDAAYHLLIYTGLSKQFKFGGGEKQQSAVQTNVESDAVSDAATARPYL
jgi:hypothetical protein